MARGTVRNERSGSDLGSRLIFPGFANRSSILSHAAGTAQTCFVLLAAYQRTSNARSRTELAAIGPGIVYVGSSLCAFAVLIGGLFALAVYPLIGVLLTIGGMALLLYGAAGLCGAHQRRKQ